MRPTRVNPVPAVPTNNASSPQGSVAVDPSFPRGSVFPDPSSPRGSPFPDPSAPKDSLFPDPSSPKGLPFPDPSSPKAPPFPDPSSPRDSFVSDSSSSKSFLSPESGSPRPSRSLNMQRSSGSVGQNSLFVDGSLQQLPAKDKGPIVKLRVPTTKAQELKHDDETPNWLCAAIALLLLCTLLLAMVSLMSVKVRELERRSMEQMDTMTLEVLVLSESLKQLQMGKMWTCAMCRTLWVQRADLCFMFSDVAMSWHSSKGFCMDESSSLAVVETEEELDFLKHESNRYFFIHHGKQQYVKFWIGLVYENPDSLRLKDGTLLDVKLTAGMGPNPCIYLQHEKLYTRHCFKAFRFICKTKVAMVWN